MPRKKKKATALSGELNYSMQVEIHYKKLHQDEYEKKKCVLCKAEIVDIAILDDVCEDQVKGLICTVCDAIMRMESDVSRKLERNPDDRW